MPGPGPGELTAAAPGDRRPRRRLFRVLAICLPLATLLALEGGLALLAPTPRADPFASVFQAFGDRRFYLPDSESFWRFRPGGVLDAPDHGFMHVTINERGLRGPEVPIARTADELRVLCLGDSITFGLGLADDETVPRRLEARLAERAELRGRRISVLNAGVPGYSAVQGLRRYEQLRDVDPQVVVFWFGMNDAKPANGVPDSAIDAEAAMADGDDWLPRLRTAEWVRGWFDEDPDATLRRVPPDEFSSLVAQLEQEEAAGGPVVVFVETPERLALTQKELETVLEQIRAHGVGQAFIPRPLASPYTPSRLEVTAAQFQRTDVDGVPTLDYPEGEEHEVVTVADLESRIGALAAWRGALEELHRRLPATRVSAHDLIPPASRAAAIEDNCHPRPDGADLVARALADVIVVRLAPR